MTGWTKRPLCHLVPGPVLAFHSHFSATSSAVPSAAKVALYIDTEILSEKRKAAIAVFPPKIGSAAMLVGGDLFVKVGGFRKRFL